MLSTFHDILEEKDVLKYSWGTGTQGVMYTCNGGFLDFGHLLDNIELTNFYHHFLTKGGNNTPGKTFVGFLGNKITIKSAIAAADRPTVAAAMAFDFSVFYEIMTYWVSGPGEHNSSFSPEDLVSNYVGTRVAEKALKATGTKFDTAVRTELKAMLTRLEPRSKAQTQAAFNAIDGVWVKDVTGGALGSGVALMDDDYLLRRNVNHGPIRPCFVTAATIGCAGVPTFPADIASGYPDPIRNTYDAEYPVGMPEAQAKLGAKITKADFVRHISNITVDAHVGVLCP